MEPQAYMNRQTRRKVKYVGVVMNKPVRRERTAFEATVETVVKLARRENLTRLGHRKHTTNPKQIRRMVRAELKKRDTREPNQERPAG